MGEVTMEFLRAFCADKLKDGSLIERNLEATIARMLFMLGTFYKIRSGYVVVFVITLGGGGGGGRASYISIDQEMSQLRSGETPKYIGARKIVLWEQFKKRKIMRMGKL